MPIKILHDFKAEKNPQHKQSKYYGAIKISVAILRIKIDVLTMELTQDVSEIIFMILLISLSFFG